MHEFDFSVEEFDAPAERKTDRVLTNPPRMDVDLSSLCWSCDTATVEEQLTASAVNHRTRARNRKALLNKSTARASAEVIRLNLEGCRHSDISKITGLSTQTIGKILSLHRAGAF